MVSSRHGGNVIQIGWSLNPPSVYGHHFRVHSHLVLFEFTVCLVSQYIYQFLLNHHVAGPQCEFWTDLPVVKTWWLSYMWALITFFFHIFPVVNSPKVVQWYPKKARDAANFHSIPQGWDVVAFIPSGFSQIISQKVVGSYSHGPMVPWSHNKFPLKTPSFDIPLLSPSISLQGNITRLYVIPNHWRHIPVYPHMPIDFPTNIPVIGRFEFTQPSIEGRSPQHPIHIPLISDFGWHFLMDLAQPTKS